MEYQERLRAMVRARSNPTNKPCPAGDEHFWEDDRRDAEAIQAALDKIAALERERDALQARVTYYEEAVCMKGNPLALPVDGTETEAIQVERVAAVLAERDALRERLAAAERLIAASSGVRAAWAENQDVAFSEAQEFMAAHDLLHDTPERSARTDAVRQVVLDPTIPKRLALAEPVVAAATAWARYVRDTHSEESLGPEGEQLLLAARALGEEAS